MKISGQTHLVYTVVHASCLSLNQIDSGIRANNWTTSVSEMRLPNIIVKLLLCLVVHIIYLSSIGTRLHMFAHVAFVHDEGVRRRLELLVLVGGRRRRPVLLHSTTPPPLRHLAQVFHLGSSRHVCAEVCLCLPFAQKYRA